MCARKKLEKNKTWFADGHVVRFDLWQLIRLQITSIDEYRYLTCDTEERLVPNMSLCVACLRIQAANFGEKPRMENGAGDSLGLTTAQVNLLAAQGGDGQTVWT